MNFYLSTAKNNREEPLEQCETYRHLKHNRANDLYPLEHLLVATGPL